MELFEQPIYFLYFIGALAAVGIIFWSGRKLKARVLSALFGPLAYRRLLGGEDAFKKLKTVLFLLGGGKWTSIPTIVGIGTIITAFFMGPLIDLFSKKFAQPFLSKEKKQ